MSESIAEMITANLHPKDADPAPAPEPVTTTPAPVVETQRPPTPVEAAPAPEPTPVTPQPTESTPAATQPPHGHVPLAAMLDERDKRKRAEEEARSLREWRSKMEAQQSVPLVHENPDAYARYQAEQLAQATTATRFDISEVMSRDKHGDTAVEQAMAWASEKSQAEFDKWGSSPFAVEYLRQKHPIDWAVRQQKAETTLSEISKDETAYIRRRAAELGMLLPATDAPAAPAATQPAAPIAPQPAPPRSLASAPSAGGPNTVPTHGLAAFDAAFSRGSG